MNLTAKNTHYNALPGLSHSTIDAMRVPIMVGVVMIHCCTLSLVKPNTFASDFIHFLSLDLPDDFCVCAFFFLSGLLFFRGLDNNVGRKLRKRVKSLLVPYVLWNFIALAIILISAYWFGDVYEYNRIHNLSFFRIVQGFLWRPYFEYPYDFPLWFIRNLIVLCIVAVPIYKIAGLRWWYIILLYPITLFDYGHYWFRLPVSFVFFYSGGIFGSLLNKAYNNISATTIERWWKWMPLLFVVYVVWQIFFYRIDPHTNIFLQYPLKICGILAVLACVKHYVNWHGYSSRGITARSLFFIYCCHGLWICDLVNSQIMGHDTSSVVVALATYVFFVALAWYADMALFIVIDRYCPRLMSLLTGGRVTSNP